MNTLLSLRLATIATLAAAAPTLAGVPTFQPLETAFAGAPGCHHVLDLLMRYSPLEGLPTLQGGAVVPSPDGSFILPANEMGDLSIASLTESAASDPACAPTFLVAVTNSSCRSVCDVQISLVALLGPIHSCDPTANACIQEIPAGATVEIAITLPIESLAMGSNGGAPVGFQKLLVAIDADDRFAEVDEVNNLRLVCRTDIPRQVIEVAPAVIESLPEAAVPETQAGTPPSSLDSALEEFGLDVQGEAAAERL
ncbi:hypothetical protein Pla108_20600 [Botrimarina colliarenosi]|uniref:CARDB domain-containing protein n=1 Tax=Botrimarina colliarenosi TaxID=2528001 RepID=A0A5C6AEQ2_9BACT|nr:hypothetical protein [Botrimarina colliarenosi]TWT97906.1 hypothetical protein Pla108_20600 [Botrimarina colliarenosi]